MTDQKRQPVINPGMKVTELLNHYPELESTLLDISPAFKKLKNPVLRKTVARVATLRQAAAVGEVPVGELINKLRVAAGIETRFVSDDDSLANYRTPGWLSRDKISATFDARPIINSGEQPLTAVLNRLNNLQRGEILELLTPFYPAPIIDKAKKRDMEIWSSKEDDNTTRTYFYNAG